MNINIFAHSNSKTGGTGASDYLIGYSDDYVKDYQNITSNSNIKFIGKTYSKRDDVTVGFVTRLDNSVEVRTTGDQIVRCGLEVMLVQSGLIGINGTPEYGYQAQLDLIGTSYMDSLLILLVMITIQHYWIVNENKRN